MPARPGSERAMRDARASQSTTWTGTSPSACRSSAASASSRGGSTATNGLNVSPPLSLDSAILAPKETREHATQLASCFVQVPAHRAPRELQHLPDLAARESGHVEQRHDHSLTIRERRERLLQDLPRVASLRLVERGRCLTHTVRLRLHAAARTRAPQVGSAIQHDADQPRPERPADLERIEVLMRRQERLLDEILRILAMSDDAIRDAERLLHVRPHQYVARGLITAARALHERAIPLGRREAFGRFRWLDRNVHAHRERDRRTCRAFIPAASGLSHL